MHYGEENMKASILLITITIILGFLYLIKKALQHSLPHSKLQKIRVENTIDLEKVKQHRAELARIKRELQ